MSDGYDQNGSITRDIYSVQMGRSVIWINCWWKYTDDPWDDDIHDGRLVEPDYFRPKKTKPCQRELVRKAREKLAKSTTRPS